MKPCKRDLDPYCARAAREKICSDLAYDIGVNVPPVVLAHRENCGSEEKYVAVSLVLYPLQWPWVLVKERLRLLTDTGKLIRDSVSQGAAAAALVFDTWVDQLDHSDAHDHNIVWGFESTDMAKNAMVFLDYAWSLGFKRPRESIGGWESEGYKKIGRAPFPPQLIDLASDQQLNAILQRVESYPEKKIRDIVTRVPESYLDEAVRGTIVDGLIYRRTLVREVIRGYDKGV
jgi:hypothetical protein